MARDREDRNRRKHNRSNGERRRHHEERESEDTENESSEINPYLTASTISREHISEPYRQSDLSTMETSTTSISTNANEELSLLQRLCDTASTPAGWDAVRNWLRVHSATDAQIAAERRGDYDTAPLHLACRNDPPPDVIQMLLMASPSTVRAADSFGWLPLHYACANDASEEVLTLLVAEYPESVTSVDRRKRTPLHFALGRTEKPADRGVVVLLSGTGAALFPDENGMLPLHYACAYGATVDALRVLTDDNIVTITATDHRGRTPLHFALGNADRPASPGVVGLLLSQNPAVVDSIDKEGNLPIHLLATRSQAIREYETEKRENCKKCLVFYLEAKPRPTAGLLMALQSLPNWLRDIAVVNPVVQRILNLKISKQFPTAITLCDFFCYILVIICYQMAVIDSIHDRATGEETLDRRLTLFLYIFAVYFIAREFVQAVSLATLGLFSTWVFDLTNWFDIAYIILILFWTVCIERQALNNNSFQVGAALTLAVYWVNVLVFLKSIIVGFAVFVGGVMYVVKRLAAFFLALLIILLAFAQMFYTIFRMSPEDYGCKVGLSNSNYTINAKELESQEVCNVTYHDDEPYSVTNDNECVTAEIEICEPSNDFPWCTFWTSFYKTYSMLLGEVDDDDFETSTLAIVVFCFYMFMVVIVLANVLIAIVTDSYSVIKNERAAVVFWSNRLDFVAEMDVIGTNVYNRCKRFRGSEDTNPEEEVSILGEVWKKLMYLFEDSDMHHGGITFELILYNLLRVGMACIVIPLWIIVGLMTFGVLWPPQVREYLLTSRLTQTSAKGEAERARLERVEVLRQDVSTFHREVKEDLDKWREDITTVRVFIQNFREQSAAEMKDVKRIVMELYEQRLD